MVLGAVSPIALGEAKLIANWSGAIGFAETTPARICAAVAKVEDALPAATLSTYVLVACSVGRRTLEFAANVVSVVTWIPLSLNVFPMVSFHKTISPTTLVPGVARVTPDIIATEELVTVL
jgi:hypothetical protein